MKILASSLLFALTAVGLVGCGEEKPRTSDWYRENPAEIKKVQDKCRAETDKGYKVEGVLKENCKAASRAHSRMLRDAVL